MRASIVVPAIPGRIDRLKSVISRLMLNAARHQDITFETIVVDGSIDGEYKQLCLYANNYIPIIYVSLPIGKFINAAYPRNVGLRLSRGEIVTQVDIDWWLSEDFIEGLYEPYNKGLSVVNRGFMIDTCKASQCQKNGQSYLESVGEFLLSPNGSEKEFLAICKHIGIDGPKPASSVWLWAAPRGAFIHIGGYDEQFCRSYAREDDSLLWQLITLLPPYFDAFSKFCGLHVWHPDYTAVQRNDPKNQINKDYYKKQCINQDGSVVVKNTVRNIGWDWGKMLKNAYSIINTEVRDYEATEAWIAQNVNDIRPYTAAPWVDTDELVRSLPQVV